MKYNIQHRIYMDIKVCQCISCICEFYAHCSVLEMFTKLNLFSCKRVRTTITFFGFIFNYENKHISKYICEDFFFIFLFVISTRSIQFLCHYFDYFGWKIILILRAQSTNVQIERIFRNFIQAKKFCLRGLVNSYSQFEHSKMYGPKQF